MITRRPLKIRGYAVPFDQVGWLENDAHGGENEFIAPYAFERQLSGNSAVSLLFDSHTSPEVLCDTDDGSLWLFADRYGLGFEAHLPVTMRSLKIMQAVARTHTFASINLAAAHWVQKRAPSCGVLPAFEVATASIDHIVLADRNAVYKGSGSWCASSVLPSPSPSERIAALMALWEASVARLEPDRVGY